MTAIVDLTPLIMPFVRDASMAATVAAARFAAIEFYKLTLWQQEMLEPIDLQTGRAIYEVETPPNTVPTLVMRIEIDDRNRVLVPKTKDQLDQLYGVDWTDREGVPTYYTQIEPNEVILVPCPDDNYLGITPPDPFNPPDPLAPPVIVRRQMRIIAAVQPTVDAAEIDDSLFNYYGEAIAYGARARLVETAGQPYYDPQAAPMLWGRFYGGVSEAKARRMRDHTRAVQHVQLRKWV